MLRGILLCACQAASAAAATRRTDRTASRMRIRRSRIAARLTGRTSSPALRHDVGSVTFDQCVGTAVQEAPLPPYAGHCRRSNNAAPARRAWRIPTRSSRSSSRPRRPRRARPPAPQPWPSRPWPHARVRRARGHASVGAACGNAGVVRIRRRRRGACGRHRSTCRHVHYRPGGCRASSPAGRVSSPAMPATSAFTGACTCVLSSAQLSSLSTKNRVPETVSVADNPVSVIW